MADNLPEPQSRKESYLAKAAGMDTTIPDAPESREEQYLAAIAEGGGGGGGSYTAGTGIDITNNEISVDTGTIQEKLTAGTNITIADNVISATGGGSITPVQTTGTSTTDVMSQNAVTSMVFADPSTQYSIHIGERLTGTPGTDSHGVTLGYHAVAATEAVTIGENARSSSSNATVIGRNANATGRGSIAIGEASYVNGKGVASIGFQSASSSYGYNNSAYRLLTGLYDPQDDHDAATKGYVDGLVGNVAAALNAINNGTQS